MLKGKNISMKNYKINIEDPSAMTLSQASKVVAETIDRGLWNTDHSVLRDNVASLRHDLNAASAANEYNKLTDDLRRRVLETVKRFNALNGEGLNKALLDDKDLPKGGGNEPEPKEKDDPIKETKPTSEGPLEERLEKLEKRVDDHDARFKENEAHLKEHDNMLGVAKNPEGVWMVVPGGNLHIVQQTANHLGYKRDKDGSVSFTKMMVDLPFNSRVAGWSFLVAFIAAMVGFVIFGQTVFTVSFFWSIGAGLAAFLVAGAITAPRKN